MWLQALAHDLPQERPLHERRFHVGMACALLCTALAGFAPSYFLKTVTHAPALNLLTHVHGAVFTAWLVLMLVQTALVVGRRVAWHRRLGVFGAMLAGTMVPLGVLMAIDAARHGRAAPGFTPHEFMIFPIGQILLFGVFVTIAVLQRKRSAIHRRFMLLATIALMTPAIARLPLVEQRPLPALALTLCFVLAGMVHDRRSRGRIHPAYVVGGILLLASGPGRLVIGHTEVWRSIARGLTGCSAPGTATSHVEARGSAREQNNVDTLRDPDRAQVPVLGQPPLSSSSSPTSSLGGASSSSCSR